MKLLPVAYYGEHRIRVFYTASILVGLVLVFLGILNYRNTANAPGFWERSEGEVFYSEPLAPESHRPTVEYMLSNGEVMRSTPDRSFRRGFEEGEEVLVRYNPLMPDEIAVARRSGINYQLYLFFGIICAGMGFRLLVGMLMRNFRIEFIKQNGKHIYPDSTEVAEAFIRIPIRKRRVFFLRCRWKNPLGSEDYTFVGEPLPSAPQVSEEGKIGEKKVSVYFLPLSADKYIIDW